MKKLLMMFVLLLGMPLQALALTVDEAATRLQAAADGTDAQQEAALDTLLNEANSDAAKQLILVMAQNFGLKSSIISARASSLGITIAATRAKAQQAYSTTVSSGGSGGSSINEVTLSNYI